MAIDAVYDVGIGDVPLSIYGAGSGNRPIAWNFHRKWKNINTALPTIRCNPPPSGVILPKYSMPTSQDVQQTIRLQLSTC